MANKIILKNSSVAAKVPNPADLDLGEVAINTTDGIMYTKKGDGTVIEIGGGGAIVTSKEGVSVKGLYPEVGVETLTDRRNPANNKPIYTQVFTRTIATTSDSITTGLTGIDSCGVVFFNIVSNTGTTITPSITFHIDSNTYIYVYAKNDGTIIETRLNGASSAYIGRPIYITIEYTKTADTSATPIALGGEVPIGGTIYHYEETPPINFLKADGRQVSETTYSKLFDTIGQSAAPFQDLMIAGKPYKDQNLTNFDNNGDLVWTTSTSTLNTGRSEAQAVVTKDRVYLFGGINSANTVTSTIQTAVINPDGTLGTFSISSLVLPATNKQFQACLIKDKIYLFGGFGTNERSRVDYIQVDPDGTIEGNSWISSSPLIVQVRSGQVVVHNNIVYYAGGIEDVAGTVANMENIEINADGTLNNISWRRDLNSLPNEISGFQAVPISDNMVYTLGGYNDTTYDKNVNSVLFDDTGAIKNKMKASALPIDNGWFQVVVNNNRMYMIGGLTSTSSAARSTVYYADINPDRSLSAWTLGNSLPEVSCRSQVIVTSSRIYLLGGRNGTALANIHNKIYEAPYTGGKNDYMSDTYLSATPDTGNFYIPKIETQYQKGFSPKYPMVRYQ